MQLTPSALRAQIISCLFNKNISLSLFEIIPIPKHIFLFI